MITREQFEAYEKVRRSGVTNMFDTRIVSALSGLTKDEIIEIMKDYGNLKEKYNGEVKPDGQIPQEGSRG